MLRTEPRGRLTKERGRKHRSPRALALSTRPQRPSIPSVQLPTQVRGVSSCRATGVPRLACGRRGQTRTDLSVLEGELSRRAERALLSGREGGRWRSRRSCSCRFVFCLLFHPVVLPLSVLGARLPRGKGKGKGRVQRVPVSPSQGGLRAFEFENETPRNEAKASLILRAVGWRACRSDGADHAQYHALYSCTVSAGLALKLKI